MENCWAHSLGDCSDKISREHIISEGIFSSPTVRVKGFEWCPNELKEVGLASLTKKVLCGFHNNSLSPLDQAAIDLFKVFKEATRLQRVREGMGAMRWSHSVFKIDGSKLETWCLKTLITLSVGGRVCLGPNSTDPNKPDKHLVRSCFSGKLEQPNGLYVSFEEGDQIQFQEEAVAIATFLNTEGRLAGARFALGGFVFLLNAGYRAFNPGPLSFMGLDGKVQRRPHPLYHLKNFSINVGKFRSHTIRFQW